MLPAARTYDELCERFRWEVPERYNMGADVCDKWAESQPERIAIIDKGRIAKRGSPAQLKAGVGKESINLAFDNRELAEKARAELSDMADNIQTDRDMVRLYMSQAAQTIPAVVNRLQSAKLDPISLTLTQPTLDDVFLQVTGQRLSVEDKEAAKAG